MKRTQCDRLLTYLQRGYKITSLEAWKELGIARLASRINDLRKECDGICDEWVEVPNRYGETCRVKRYWMEKEGVLF